MTVLLTFDNIPLQHMYKFIKQPSMFLSIKRVVAILNRSLPAVAAGVFRQFGLAGYLPAWLQSTCCLNYLDVLADWKLCQKVGHAKPGSQHGELTVEPCFGFYFSLP